MTYIQQLFDDVEFKYFFPSIQQAIDCLAEYEQAYLTNNKTYFRRSSSSIKMVLLGISNPYLSLPSTQLQGVLQGILTNVARWSVEKELFSSVEKFGDFMYAPFYTQQKHLLMGRIFEQIYKEILKDERNTKLKAVKTA